MVRATFTGEVFSAKPGKTQLPLHTMGKNPQSILPAPSPPHATCFQPRAAAEDGQTHGQRDNCLLKAGGSSPPAQGCCRWPQAIGILICFAKIYFGITSPVAASLAQPRFGAACFANRASGDLGSVRTSLPSRSPLPYYLFFPIFYRAFFPSGSKDARVNRTQPRCHLGRGDLRYLFTDARHYRSLAKGCQVFFVSGALLCRARAYLCFRGGLIQGLSSTGWGFMGY